MTTPITSPPAWAVPDTGTALAGAPSAIVQPPPPPVARARGSGSFRRGLEDVVLLVVGVFLFPVIIILVGSPFALLVKAVIAGVHRIF